MKNIVAALLLASLAGIGSAHASNELVLLGTENPFNATVVDITGDSNRVTILQEHRGVGGANLLELSIKGDLNGGPLGEAFTAPVLTVGLEPGSLVQQGFGNRMSVEVSGTGNLFALAQIGSGNRLTASITGQRNQAAVLQVGNNNISSFSQNGTGNSVSIVQRSW